MQMLPTRYESVAMVIAAFVLFVLEAKYPSHGLFTAGGMAMMVLGMLLLVDGPIPEMRVKLVTALSVAIPLGAITVFLLTLAIRARRNKVMTGKESLVEKLGSSFASAAHRQGLCPWRDLECCSFRAIRTLARRWWCVTCKTWITCRSGYAICYAGCG